MTEMGWGDMLFCKKWDGLAVWGGEWAGAETRQVVAIAWVCGCETEAVSRSRRSEGWHGDSDEVSDRR